MESGSVHVWHISCDYSIDFSVLNSVLTNEEQSRTKPNSRIARAYLRILLGHYLNLSPAKVSFNYSPEGKPFTEGISFNVSHSKNLIAIALSKGQAIGIDVEEIQNKSNFIEIAKRFFTKEEIVRIEELRSLSERSQLFFQIWTCKEAILKATGRGIGGLAHVNVLPVLSGATLDLGEKKIWTEPLHIHPQYASAFSIIGPKPTSLLVQSGLPLQK